jgi:hypothetical protein
VFSFAKSLLSRRLFLIGTLFLLVGGLPAPSLLSSEPLPAPEFFTIGAFTFVRPLSWDWIIPSSSIRKVELSVAPQHPASHASADVSFFYFGNGEGGSTQANIDRWAKQFTAPDGSPAHAVTESRNLGGIPITFITVNGVYSAGMMDGSAEPQHGFSLRGAILENPQGAVFVKMTGPEATVREATPAFDSMILHTTQKADSE